MQYVTSHSQTTPSRTWVDSWRKLLAIQCSKSAGNAWTFWQQTLAGKHFKILQNKIILYFKYLLLSWIISKQPNIINMLRLKLCRTTGAARLSIYDLAISSGLHLELAPGATCHPAFCHDILTWLLVAGSIMLTSCVGNGCLDFSSLFLTFGVITRSTEKPNPSLSSINDFIQIESLN